MPGFGNACGGNCGPRTTRKRDSWPLTRACGDFFAEVFLPGADAVRWWRSPGPPTISGRLMMKSPIIRPGIFRGSWPTPGHVIMVMDSTDSPHVTSGVRKWGQDFAAFIRRGNVVDLAVGVMIGAAFGKIVTS